MDGESSVCSTSTDKSLSPGRNRTMKEYEEQMAELKKENFNLKLRIYFIEERQEQLKGVKDIEELFNKNLELSCELDSLRKDLSEKEELLIQSARAVEILQIEHQEKIEQTKSELEKEKSYLEDHITNLQKALKEKDKRLSQLDNNSSHHRLAFGCSRESIEEREQASLRAELSNITKKYVDLEEELEAERENYSALQQKLENSSKENVCLKAHVRTLKTELEKREAHLQQAYIDLERKNGLPQSSEKSLEQDGLTQKEEDMAELVKMINDIEQNFETSVNSKHSDQSLSLSSSSNNSLSCKDQPEKSSPSILRHIFFRTNR